MVMPKGIIMDLMRDSESYREAVADALLQQSAEVQGAYAQGYREGQKSAYISWEEYDGRLMFEDAPKWVWKLLEERSPE